MLATIESHHNTQCNTACPRKAQQAKSLRSDSPVSIKHTWYTPDGQVRSTEATPHNPNEPVPDTTSAEPQGTRGTQSLGSVLVKGFNDMADPCKYTFTHIRNNRYGIR